MEWHKGPYYNFSIKSIFQYFAMLSVNFHDMNALFGFFTFLVLTSQMISGTMLAFSLMPEPMLIPMVSEEEDTEDLYIDDFFWLHESGVDLLFMFMYFHFWSKLYLNVFEYENESAWKSGVFTFLIFQLVVFAGLILCCTHLSEMTLTMSVNMLHTFFAFKGKMYWWFFTDKQLNTDTMISLAYIHYLTAFYMVYLGLIHGMDMHYDWKNETTFDGLDSTMIWWDEALSNELSFFLDTILILTIVWWFVYLEPEALNYELFMWGDMGLVTDISYYGVAPHWYFSPYMAWIMACPNHKLGMFGLLWYFFTMFYQPNLHGTTEFNNYNKKKLVFFKNKFKKNYFFTASYMNLELNLYHQMTFGLYMGTSLYSASFLPYGSFYNSLGGNVGLLISFTYMFMYLGFSLFSSFVFLEMFYYFLYLSVNFLKNLK